jgi:hypothetical protein
MAVIAANFAIDLLRKTKRSSDGNFPWSACAEKNSPREHGHEQRETVA